MNKYLSVFRFKPLDDNEASHLAFDNRNNIYIEQTGIMY